MTFCSSSSYLHYYADDPTPHSHFPLPPHFRAKSFSLTEHTLSSFGAVQHLWVRSNMTQFSNGKTSYISFSVWVGSYHCHNTTNSALKLHKHDGYNHIFHTIIETRHYKHHKSCWCCKGVVLIFLLRKYSISTEASFTSLWKTAYVYGMDLYPLLLHPEKVHKSPTLSIPPLSSLFSHPLRLLSLCRTLLRPPLSRADWVRPMLPRPGIVTLKCLP